MSSELKFERQLDGSRAANLVEGIEAAVGAAGAEATGQRLCRKSEQGAGQVVIRRAEVGVVEGIEQLRPELEVQSLRQVKLPLNREVDLRGPEAA